MNRVIRVVSFVVVFLMLLAAKEVHAQSCDCPPASECEPCVGGLINITLRYDGLFTPALVSAIDGAGNVVMAPTFIANGQIFTINSAVPSEKFGGDRVFLSVTALPHATINTSCSAVPYINDTYGDFVIIAATSKQNGALCCDASDVDANPPVFTNCPTDIFLTIPDEQCALMATWTAPDVTDDCDVDVTSTHASGTLFPVGTTQVVYTAEDTYGNVATCLFNVIVTESEPPAFTICVDDVFVNADGDCDAIATWTIPTASDNCTAVTITSDFDPGDSFPLGETEVTYTAEDVNGNVATCSFVVYVIDETAPVITGCPGDIELDAGNACEISVSWIEPNATDCSSFTLSSTASPDDMFPVGTTTVTYTATDAEDNITTCSFNVIVTESISPEFTDCPTSEIHVVADENCQAVATWTPPDAADDCSDVTIISTHGPGDLFDFGETIVTYTATDESGNESSCQFKVIVNDETPPVFTTCVSDIGVVAGGDCDAIATWTIPIASDNCSAVTITSDFNPGDLFPFGETEVVYTAEDADGNKAYCTFIVNVVDDSPPVLINCPGNIEVDAGNACEVSVSWTVPNVTDCSSYALTSSASPNDIFPVGTTTVTYTAKDANDKTATCSFNVVVTESFPPVFTGCPTDEIHVMANGECQAVATWTPPVANDNCSDVSVVSAHNPGDLFDYGETIVTYTASDESGNEAICEIKIIVEEATAPIITDCPSIVEVEVDDNCDAVVNWPEPVITDACSEVNVSKSHMNGATFPIGTTEVVYTATDESGNISSCTFNVVVVDKTPPAADQCPENIVVTIASGCSSLITWTPPQFSDNCDDVQINSSANPGDLFEVGTTTVTYTAIDESGNVAECIFNVTVKDQVSPTLENCAIDITINATDDCKAVVSWTAPNAVDNCSEVTLIGSHAPGDFFEYGATVVEYEATDVSGNKSTCSFTVEVNDNIPPVFADCPTDITIDAASDCAAVVTWTPPGIADNCGEPTMQNNFQPGDQFEVGTTEVVYTAMDAQGFTSTCRFFVTVTDNAGPLFSNCPADIVISNAAGCSVPVTWTAPDAVDNCQTETVSSTHQPGDLFDVGTTVVTYSAVDIHGNETECSFEIFVTDESFPVIEGCPGDIEVKTINDGEVIEWTPPSATSQCGIVDLSASHSPSTFFSIGKSEVTYTATNAAGNVTSCSFFVNVVEQELAFDIAKIVTPDGDGINDAWNLRGIEKFKNNAVTVIDRWGGVIFSATGYNNESVVWQGENTDGVVVPSGTYFYTITVETNRDRKELTGFLEVIR